MKKTGIKDTTSTDTSRKKLIQDAVVVAKTRLQQRYSVGRNLFSAVATKFVMPVRWQVFAAS